MNLLELTQPLRRGLAGLRRRVRSLLLVLGVSRSVTFLGIALLAFFLADYFLRLPLSVRIVFLLALVGGTAAVAVRRLLLPLATRLSDEALAARVEAAHPELEDRLKSSLAFSRAADDPENEDSPELMRAVVEETVRRVGSIPFGDVAQGGLATRWAVGASTLALCLALFVAAQPALASTFAQRALLLRDVAWPRRTTLDVVGMTPGEPRRVTLGREATLQVRAQGSLPDRVRFTFWEANAGRGESDTIELTPSAEEPSLFAFTLKIYTSYRFTISGGDDDRELEYEIEALTPPSILGVTMDATYPEYLDLAPATLRGGGQRVPQGTKLRLNVKTNMDLESASIAIQNQAERPLEAVGPQLYATDLEATGNLRYSLRLVGTNGEENDPGIDTFLLQVVRDQVPSIRIRTPASRAERVAFGVALIAFSARDDHRLAKTEFLYRVNDEKERAVAVGEAGGDALRILTPAELPADHVWGVVALDFSQLRKADGSLVAKGDRFNYTIEATDSSGRKRRTRAPYRIDLGTEDDITRALQVRQRELRESVGRADGRAQDAAGKRLSIADARATLTAATTAGQDTRDAQHEFKRASAIAQASQARVVDHLASVASRVRGVLNLYVFNRQGDRSAVDQVLPYYERHLLEPSERGGDPYRSGLYRSIYTAMTERRIRVGDGQRKLIEMTALADRLAAEHGPRAYQALGRVAAAASDDETETALEEARIEQQAIIEGLERLARLMREWESYDGVVRFFKQLRDREKGIVERLGSPRDENK